MKVEYSEGNRMAFFNGYKFRKDVKTGYYLSTKPTDIGHRERLHCYVWRYHNGNIPYGFHIHHEDENKDHNDIENLVLMSKGEHVSLHISERWEREPDKMARNLIEYAVPASKAWHASEEGKKFHSEHAKITAQNLKCKEFVCECCGKHFFKKPLGANKYCSNACKTRARFKSGVDNETRLCVLCGKPFIANKYTKRKCCSDECWNKLRWDTRHKEMRERACV